MDWLRVSIVIAHLLAFAFALSTVLMADYALLRHGRIHMQELEQTHRTTKISLLALVATGLVLTGMDTGFHLAIILAKPKLLAKFSVVALLVLNGLALEAFAFPLLRGGPKARAPYAAPLLCVLGAASFSAWMYATFLGVARPFALRFSYADFMGLFVLLLMGAAASSLLFMRQRVQRLLENTPVHSASAHSTSVQAVRMTDGRSGHVTFRSPQWSSLGGTLPV